MPKLNIAKNAEAYKRLRTNLQFALPGEEEGVCRVIGVTSPSQGEGKGSLAVHLSYALAEEGKRVLLIDGDMRLPYIGKNMGLQDAPGLSNALVASGGGVKIAVRSSGVFENWRIITSGDLPPNPALLLSSRRMQGILKALRKEFDHILLDLPPVNAVSDALAVSPLLDGVVVAVSENRTRRRDLRACIRELHRSRVRLLGVVMTDTNGQMRTQMRRSQK